MKCIGPILIGSEPEREDDPVTNLSTSWKRLPPHRDEDQVQLDVNRAFVYYPNGEFNASWDFSAIVRQADLAPR
jgi:TBC1 domain family member 20